MVGIKETKEVLACVLDFSEGIAVSLDNDGEIGWEDAINFVGALKSIPSAFAGISEVPAELSDLTPEEIEELVTYVVEEFDIPQDTAEERIERALKIGLEIYDYVQDLISDFDKEVEENA